MTPYEWTIDDWKERPREQTLEWCEGVMKRSGFVYITPTFFVMGRPVVKNAPVELIRDIEHVFDYRECDTWHVFQLTGDVDKAWRILPWEMEWMCWERSGDSEKEMRFYRMETLLRLSEPSI